MGAQVLERLEPGAERTEILRAVVRDHGLLQSEVARGPGARPAERAGQEPVGRPLAEAANRYQPRLDLLVRKLTKLLEIELRARERDDVLGLAPREPELDQLFLPRGRDSLARRKRPRVLGAIAEALDHPAAHGERCEHRDLLGRDRADERFERIRRERRPEAGQLARQPREHGIRLREVVEGGKVERRAEQSEHDGRIAVR